MIKKQLFILLFVFINFHEVVYSQPSETILYLINEPVSLMDFGLYRSQIEISNYLKNKNVFESIETAIFQNKNGKDPTFFEGNDVRFDYDNNLIVVDISVVYFSNQNPNIKAVKKVLKSEIVLFKKYLNFLVFGDDVEWFFSHSGYQKKDQPASFYEDIKKVVKIKIEVSHGEKERQTSDSKWKVVAESMLIEDEIFFNQ